jgi:regulatory Fis family protein
MTLAELERDYILMTMDHFRWHRGKAAAALGIHVKTLATKLKEYQLPIPEPQGLAAEFREVQGEGAGEGRSEWRDMVRGDSSCPGEPSASREGAVRDASRRLSYRPE